MTTDPTLPSAPLPDLDALTALERSLDPAPWRVMHDPDWSSAVWITEHACINDLTPEQAEFFAAARNNWSALLSALTATRAELDTVTRQRDEAVGELEQVTRERHEAVDLLRTIWYGTVNAPARERWLRLMAGAAPAAAPKPDEPVVREVTLADAAQQARLNLIEAEQRRTAQDDEPEGPGDGHDDEAQDNESLFESHRLADGTMPDTIPVTDSEHDAPDGATIDGYTRCRDTWVKGAVAGTGQQPCPVVLESTPYGNRRCDHTQPCPYHGGEPEGTGQQDTATAQPDVLGPNDCQGCGGLDGTHIHRICGRDTEPAAVPAADTCGAVCPDITTITCTEPAGHDPIQADTGWPMGVVPLAHFSEPYATGWNPGTAWFSRVKRAAVPAAAGNTTCGSTYIGDEGEFTCTLYAPHDGRDHWNALAEFGWPAAVPAGGNGTDGGEQ